MQTPIFVSGWKRDKQDRRDLKFNSKDLLIEAKAPTSMDLRSSCPPVIDQGNLGSCTACATTAMVQFVRRKQKFPEWTPSALFTYYGARQLEGTVKFDDGAYVRDALKATAQYGIVPELFWQYNIAKFAVKPPPAVWTEATKHQTLKYYRIDNTKINDLTACLNDGYPFVFGMEVYESFMTSAVSKSGVVPMPKDIEKLLGGHCMMCVGYTGEGSNLRFIVQNSWGKGWGQKGYCTIPSQYLTNSSKSTDFWTIRITES